MKKDLLDHTIPELQALLKKRAFSHAELLSEVCEIINKYEHTLHAYITQTADQALKQAETLDSTKSKPDSLLVGMPLSVKDSLTTAGVRTTVGSKILEDYIPPYDATSYRRLKEQGTILLGKTNMDEFAHGFTTEYSAFGPTRNPWNTNLVPGGSSGGAAAAVASRECLLALATENWGSIIQPAALCGVVGMKPTYGRSSRYGIIAMASSLECPGIIGRCVEDVAVGIEAISGHDPLDATSVDIKTSEFSKRLSTDILGSSISFVASLLDRVPHEISSAINSVIAIFRKLGVTVNEISWYDFQSDADIYDTLYRAEVASNLSRYDGIRYGHRGHTQGTLDEFYLSSRAVFGDKVKRQITTDPVTLGENNIYLDALRLRRRNQKFIDHIFECTTAIITPATAYSELPLGKSMDPLWRDTHRDLSKNTAAMLCPTVLYGYPSISFPIGYSKNHLPIGINMFAARFNEQALLNLAYAFQEETGLKCLKPATIT